MSESDHGFQGKCHTPALSAGRWSTVLTGFRCYIACEIKVKPFEPEFTGKLNYYVSAVDELVKAPDDNPTIGLLICSDMDKTDVQWSFRGITTPMGVATYNNIRIKDVLPTKEQLKERMELLQKELRATKRLMKKSSE